MHNKRIVRCLTIGRELTGSISVTVIGMVNPLYSGNCKQFALEILEGTSSRVLEKKWIDGNVVITPGILSVTLERENDYKLANVSYKFQINTANDIGKDSRLYINFTNEWNLYDT